MTLLLFSRAIASLKQRPKPKYGAEPIQSGYNINFNRLSLTPNHWVVALREELNVYRRQRRARSAPSGGRVLINRLSRKKPNQTSPS